MISCIHLLLNHEENLLQCLFHDNGDTACMTEQEQLRLSAASDMWQGTSLFKLSHLFHDVDDQNFLLFLKFLVFYRELQIDSLHALIDSIQPSFP